MSNPQTPPNPKLAGTAWLELVQQYVASRKFGTVTISIHDGRVVQVEFTEKVRLHDETVPEKKRL